MIAIVLKNCARKIAIIAKFVCFDRVLKRNYSIIAEITEFINMLITISSSASLVVRDTSIKVSLK